MSTENFMSFDETMKRLGLTEEQLMEEVASNHLRSYMKDREMHFKKEEVETMAANREMAAIPPKDLPQDSGEILLLEGANETVEEKPVELVSQEEDSDLDLKPDSSEIELISISKQKESEAAAAAEPSPPAKEKAEPDSDEIIFADDDISFDLDETEIAAGIEEVEETDLVEAEEAKPEMMAAGDATVQTEVIETDDLAPSLDQPAVSLASVRSESVKSGMVAYRPRASDVATLWYVLLAACLVFSIIPLTALFTAVFQDTPLLMRGDNGKVIPDSSGTFIPEPISTLSKAISAKDWWGAPRIIVPQAPARPAPRVTKKATPDRSAQGNGEAKAAAEPTTPGPGK